MAEEIKESVETEAKEQASTHESEGTAEKTFTQAEVTEKIQQAVNRAVAKAHKDAEEKFKAEQGEAKKLAKMNAEQKAEYEQKKQAKEIADLKAQLNRNALEKEASKLLSEAGIVADDEILGFVVKEDAEGTQEAINRFSSLVNDVADKKVSEALKGRTPGKVGEQSSAEITKERFDRMGYRAQLDLKKNNPELYEQLTKG